MLLPPLKDPLLGVAYVLLGNLWHARVKESLAWQRSREWERPHPELWAQYLLHILEPEHIVTILQLLWSSMLGPRLVVPTEWDLYHLILHHLKSSYIVVDLIEDSQCERDESI